MTVLYLVRHTKYHNPTFIYPGRLPVQLSTVGTKQAKRLADYFRTKNIARIYSSPVLRCIQTSEIISDSQVPVSTDLRLAENLSAMQGLKKTHNWWAAYFGHVGELGGETQQDVQNRMVEFFDETQFEDDKSYVICSHGGPLFFLYQKLNNEPLFIDLGPEEPEGYLDYGQVMKITLNGKDVVEIGPIESPATK